MSYLILFQNFVHSQLYLLAKLGQSELVTTNAPFGHFIHWMGCIFSFSIIWGSSQSISFCCWTLYLFFTFLVIGRFSLGTDLTHTYPTHLPQTLAHCGMSDSLGTSSIFSKCKAPKKLAFIHREVTLSIIFETNKMKEWVF